MKLKTRFKKAAVIAATLMMGVTVIPVVGNTEPAYTAEAEIAKNGLSGRYYYVKGKKVTNTWKKISNSWYYFGKDGKYVTGWNVIGNKKYYFEVNGKMYTKGWHQIGKRAGRPMWYYMTSSGAVYAGWKKLGGKWRYFMEDKNSANVEIHVYKDHAYYGMMVAGGTMSINHKRYYFNDEGEMVTGWVKMNNHWYYFSTDVKDNGAMLLNCKRKIGNKTYIFNKSGICTNR